MKIKHTQHTSHNESAGCAQIIHKLCKMCIFVEFSSLLLLIADEEWCFNRQMVKTITVRGSAGSYISLLQIIS